MHGILITLFTRRLGLQYFFIMIPDENTMDFINVHDKRGSRGAAHAALQLRWSAKFSLFMP